MNDFEQQAWNWAKSDKFWKSRITTTAKLRERLMAGESFRLQFEDKLEEWRQQITTATPSVKSSAGQMSEKTSEVIDAAAAAIEACPYCDEGGVVTFKAPNQNLGGRKCDHKADRIKTFFIKVGATEISTARIGFRNHQAPTQPPSFNPKEKIVTRAKLGAMIGKFETEEEKALQF
ncbi:MAG: hypothetical protein DRR19_24105 [Candidatus Parabeggiatoa sp. nov. 1]|nr:MAG: hypothetical protein DRR19_24105 [Gammaproteobacteria bacterium]